MRVAVNRIGRLVLIGLLASAGGVVNADTDIAETQLLKTVNQLKLEGKLIDALVLLRDASVSCVRCQNIDAALAGIYCDIGDYGRAAQLLNQTPANACGPAGVTALPVRSSPFPATATEGISPVAAAPTIANATALKAQPILNENLAAVTARAELLLAKGQANSAYELLKPFDARALGDSDFDYVMGIAALDSGRPGEAVFALSRVVAEQPEFLGARLELGRAFYERGDYQHAERIFSELKAQQPPEAAAKVIERYLEGIKNNTKHQQRSIAGYIEAGIGGDSNATAGTDARTVGVFLLDPIARRKSSVRREIGLGVEAKLPIGARWQALLAADGRVVDFPEAEFVSGNAVGASLGMAYRRHQWRLQGAVAGNYQTFDSQFNHVGNHLILNAERLVGDNWRLRLGYKTGQVEFANELNVLDVDQRLLTAGFGFIWRGNGQPAVSASLLLGRDDAVVPGSPFGRNLGGIRMQYARGLGAGRLYATASFLNSNYHGSFGDGFNSERREDSQQWLSLSWSVEHWPYQNWRISPEILLLNNDSGVEVYDYQRGWAMLTLRRGFE